MVPIKRFAAICIAVAAIGWWVAGEIKVVQSQSGGLSFRVLSPAETGLGEIMQRWHVEELARQAGACRSHCWWPWGVNILDYDNDGDLDLLISQHGVPRGMLVRNQFRETGTLTFVNATPEIGLANRNFPIADDKPAIWDFDGDGRLDIAGLSNESRGNPSFFNRPNGTFQLAPFSFYPLSTLNGVADLNGDGYLDAWGITHSFGSQQYNRNNYIYQPGGATFTLQRFAYEPPSAMPPSVGEFVREQAAIRINQYLRIEYLTDYDLNGDGVEDIVAHGYAAYGGVAFGRYCISQTSGTCVEEGVARGLPETGTPVLIRDMNSDGHLDVLVAAGGAASGLYLNDGSGRFTQTGGDARPFLERRGSYLHHAFAVDFDRDTDLDLVLSIRIPGNGEMYENIGDGLFKRIQTLRGWQANPIAIGDLNNDGLVDVVVGGPDADSVTVYLNNTPAPGNYINVVPRMDTPNPFAVGARVEVFRAGTIDGPGTRPYFVEEAHLAGQPVHVGLGTAGTVDLRVVFPDGSVTTRSGAEAAQNLTVTSERLPAIRQPRVPPARPVAR